MRIMTLGLSAVLLSPFAAAAPAVAASSAAAPDWRTEACSRDVLSDAPISGTGTITASTSTRVSELPGVKLVNERLDFSGVTCELLYTTGSVPTGSALRGVAYDYTTFARLAVDGVDKGETEYIGYGGTSVGSGGIALDDNDVLAAVTYHANDSGVFPTDPSLPPEWQGKPYTAAYTRSAWDVTLTGKALAEKSFRRSAATDRAARAASVRTIAEARASYGERVAAIRSGSASAAEKKAWLTQARRTQASSITLARKTLRLALAGTRLVPKKFRATHDGALTAG